MPKEAFKSCSAFPAPPNTKSDEVPSALFNGMIAPFQYMSVRAALWYQGEGEAVDVLPAFLPPCLPAFLPSCFPAFLLSCLPFFFIIMSSSPCRALNVSQRTCSHFYKRSDLPPSPASYYNSQCRPAYRAVRKRRLAHCSVCLQAAGDGGLVA